jgi:protein TonB
MPAPAERAVAPLAAPAPAAARLVDPAWQAAVAGWLLSHKAYPEDARRRGDEGRVVVRITVDRSGRVLDASVVGPSGSELLDSATVAMLRNASLPAFPASMAEPRITISTSIRYSLR